MVEPVRPGQPWLHGPVPDLLFGCGALFAVVGLIFGFGGAAAFGAVPAAVPAMLVAFVSAPHYGATLLRVYDRRSDRQAHFAWGVVATALIAGIFGVALVHRWTGSLLATVYLTWTGWHYTAQNFGIAMMYARRRGHSLVPRLRRSLHASFVLSFVLVFLVMHGQQAPIADPSLEVRLIPLGIPAGLDRLAVAVVLSAYLGATVHALFLLVRGSGRLADGLPIAAIVATQAVWWSLPYAVRHFGVFRGIVPLGADWRSAFFVWVAVAHAAQYLWITSHFARAEAGFRGFGNYYGRALLAGSAIWMLPALAFAPATDAFDWNFAMLLAAAVNVHHFVLDGAIWKLRQSRIARVLIEDRAEAEADERSGGWLRGAVHAAAALGLMLSVASLVDRFYVLPSALAQGRLAEASRALDRFARYGTTDSVSRFQLGRRYEAAGDLEQASIQYELSARNVPRIEPYRRLLAIYERTDRDEAFGRTCDALFALEGEGGLPVVSAGAKGGPAPTGAGRREACLGIAQRLRARPVDAAVVATRAARAGGAAPLVRYE